MKQPIISIIIPTFNRVHLLKETLNSFLKQSYTFWEVIIVDDGSSDGTIIFMDQFIKKDPRFYFYIRPENLKKGAGSCRNLGLEKCKGKYIQFFDDDDLPDIEMLSRKMVLFLQFDVDVVVNKLRIVENENTVIKFNKISSEELIFDYFTNKIAWYVSGPMWKKSFLKEKFDPEIEMLDDWDFNLRNLYHNPKVLFIQHPLMSYCKRTGETTLSIANDLKHTQSQFRAIKKHFHILKEMRIQKIESLRLNYLLRITGLLRSSLVKKYPTKRPLFREIVINSKPTEFIKVLRLFIGYLSFFLFNKGYGLIYFKK